jgi:amino acid transporter
VCLATANVGTRMWYRMAKNGSFPRQLARVDARYKTPVNAILLQLAISLGVGIGVGLGWAADVGYFLVDGLVLVLAVAVVYLMANVAVFTFYRRERPNEFNIILHVIFPVISSAALIYAVYKSFSPAPASPYNLSPYIDGAWLVLGIVILLVMRARGKEGWLQTAGESLADVGEA